MLSISVKLLTIFHEGKLSKYFSNELMKNGWKYVRYNGKLLIELDRWADCKNTLFLTLPLKRYKLLIKH